MAERFLKFIPSEEAFWLMTEKPNAFRLLTHIANTARRTHGNPDGLTIGQCHLQHWTFYKLTEREYRTAKQILVDRKHIKIIETNRTRQKSTTGMTTKSTLVEICSTTVYDINPESTDDRNDDRPTTDRRLTDDKQERIRKNKNEEEDKKNNARTDNRPRSKDALTFNFDSWTFEGILEKEIAEWKIMYPHLDLQVEMLKAAQWLKNNPSKSRKKNWRKYLTGWFERGNDRAENKKAFRTVAGNSAADRRTKDVEGNPVENQYKGKF